MNKRVYSREKDYWWQWLSVKVNCILTYIVQLWPWFINKVVMSLVVSQWHQNTIVPEDSKFEWWVSIRSVFFHLDICHFIFSPTFGFWSVSLLLVLLRFVNNSFVPCRPSLCQQDQNNRCPTERCALASPKELTKRYNRWFCRASFHGAVNR